MKFLKSLTFLSCVMLLVSSCVSVPTQPKLPSAPKNFAPSLAKAERLDPYLLQIGDVIDIKLMLNPELNEQVVVRPDGMISTTVADDVMAYGRTTSQVRRALEAEYKQVLHNPHIGVLVRSFAPNRFYVTGEVTTPGEFISVGPSLTLLQAIARAGGVKGSAQTDKILIIRRGASEKVQAFVASYNEAASGRDPASDVRLAPYDVVYVPRSGIANIYLHFNQYIQQFVPVSAGASYQINNTAYSR